MKKEKRKKKVKKNEEKDNKKNSKRKVNEFFLNRQLRRPSDELINLKV